MEEKILKRVTIFVMAVSAAACIMIPFFPRLGIVSEEMLAAYKEYRTKTKAERLNMTWLELLEYNNKQAEEEAEGEMDFESQLRLELPLGVTGEDLEIEEKYVLQTIDIRIPFAGDDYFYEYPVLGRSDNIDSLNYEYKNNYGTVEFVTDQVYELRTSYDEKYFYLDFEAPRDLYDKVVVIDAGHGGNAPGAVKQGVCEKDIDLDIVLKLKELFEASEDKSIGVYYTRTEDADPSLENRIGLANKSDADLFISVHSNSTKSGRMSSINGTQVMYNETEEETEKGSKGLAQICLEEVTAVTGSSNKGLIEGSDIYIIRSSNMPAALIEVGFMTNQAELDNLRSEAYQAKAAQGIYNAIMRAFEEGY